MRGLASDPAPGELTSRYLRQSGHYVPSINRVKPQAFHPNPKDYKTSIFRIESLSESQIWKLGDTFINLPSGNKPCARADLLVLEITGIGLQVESKEPPLRHANIAGWASEKDKMMNQAQELAAVARLRLRVTHPA
jgi:hypothetical protein